MYEIDLKFKLVNIFSIFMLITIPSSVNKPLLSII